MAPDTGRHDADENAADRARIDYLAGEIDSAIGTDVRLGDDDRAQLDELRALLADPTLWAEPPAELEDAVVAAIVAEAATLPPLEEKGSPPPAVTGSATPPAQGTAEEPPAQDTAEAPPAQGSAEAPAQGIAEAPPAHGSAETPRAPADLSAARRRREERTRRAGWARPTMLVAAAAALVAVVVSGILVFRPAGERTFDVAFESTGVAPTATGSAVMIKTESGWKIELNVIGLPRLDGGRFYQGWLRSPDGVLVPIGTFNEGTDVVLWSGVSPDAFPVLTVTQEEADGNQASSGVRVLVGTAVEVK
jgi:hypothetical protein